MDLALFYLRQGSLEWRGGFNYVKSAGRGNNDNQLRFISVEPAAKRK